MRLKIELLSLPQELLDNLPILIPFLLLFLFFLSLALFKKEK